MPKVKKPGNQGPKKTVRGILGSMSSRVPKPGGNPNPDLYKMALEEMTPLQRLQFAKSKREQRLQRLRDLDNKKPAVSERWGRIQQELKLLRKEAEKSKSSVKKFGLQKQIEKLERQLVFRGKKKSKGGI